MNIEALSAWTGIQNQALIISGPCSAETEEQVLHTARQLKALNKVHIFRAGIWKPRTRPGSFEGIGEVGLQWLAKAKEETGFKTAVEVAKKAHVEQALASGVDILWIGARTTANPFSVQEIADTLQGIDIPVLVKNPVIQELELWIGGIERIAAAGITKIAAVHRGFSNFGKSIYRNNPQWHIPIDLRLRIPNLPIICDPSHICGERSMIGAVAQKALNLDFDGLMIESHINPEQAWSDAQQQLRPSDLGLLLNRLQYRKQGVEKGSMLNQLELYRQQIDQLDSEMLELLARRMDLSGKIGELKKENNLTILQIKRWQHIINTLMQQGLALGLSNAFMKQLLAALHLESINRQNAVMNPK